MTDSKSLKVGALQHKKSNVVENGAPKLPSAEKLLFGEIAINYAEGYETLSIKNSSENVVTFSSDNINEGKLDKVKQDLTQAVADEKARAEAKEGEVAQAVTDETAARQEEDGKLSQAVAGEKARAEGKEGELEQSIADNKAALEAEDAKLAQAVADEKTRAEGAEEKLGEDLATAVSRLEGLIGDVEGGIAGATTITEKTDGYVKISASTDEVTGALIYTITENDIASDTDLIAINEKIDAFLNAAEIGDAAVDTLKEIQDYIDTHGEAAAQMVADIADNKTAISALTQTVTDNKATLDAKDGELAQAIADKQDRTINDTYTAVTYPTIDGVTFMNVESGNDIQTAIRKVDDNVAKVANAVVAETERAMVAESGLTETIGQKFNMLANQIDAVSAETDTKVAQLEKADVDLNTAILTKQNRMIDETYTAVTYPTVDGVTFKNVNSNNNIQTAIHIVDDNVASLANAVVVETERAKSAESGLTETIGQQFTKLANQIDAVSADTDTKVAQLEKADVDLNTAILQKQDKTIDETYTAVTYPTVDGVTFKNVESGDGIQTAIHKVDDNVAQLATALNTKVSDIYENYDGVTASIMGVVNETSSNLSQEIARAKSAESSLAEAISQIRLSIDVTPLISNGFMEITFDDLAASNLYCALEDGVIWAKGDRIGEWEDYVNISDGNQYYFINKTKGKETIVNVWVSGSGEFKYNVCETIPTDATEIKQSFYAQYREGWVFYNMSAYKYNVTPARYVGECANSDLLGGFLIVETMTMTETTTNVYYLTETTRDGIYGLMVDKDKSFEYVSNTYSIMKVTQTDYNNLTKNDKTLYVIEGND